MGRAKTDTVVRLKLCLTVGGWREVDVDLAQGAEEVTFDGLLWLNSAASGSITVRGVQTGEAFNVMVRHIVAWAYPAPEDDE